MPKSSRSLSPNSRIKLTGSRAPAVWQRSPSPFARVMLAGYVLMFVLGCLMPFSGWRSLGLGPLSWLTAPVPQYYTKFDVVLNLLMGVPLGALLVLSLYPAARGMLAIVAAVLIAVLLSGGVETAQGYLPLRVASKIDFWCNVGGAAIGAIVITPITAWLIDHSVLARLRLKLLERDGLAGVVLLAAWWVIQWRVQVMPFEMGDAAYAFGKFLERFDVTMPWIEWARQVLLPNAVFISALLAGAVVAMVGVMLSFVLRPSAAFAPVLMLLIAIAVCSKLGVEQLVTGRVHWLPWQDAVLWGGAAAGFASAWAIAKESVAFRRRVFQIAWVAAMIIVNCMPRSAYFEVSNQAISGVWVHFEDVIFWLSLAWPILALIWLDRISRRRVPV